MKLYGEMLWQVRNLLRVGYNSVSPCWYIIVELIIYILVNWCFDRFIIEVIHLIIILICGLAMFAPYAVDVVHNYNDFAICYYYWFFQSMCSNF